VREFVAGVGQEGNLRAGWCGMREKIVQTGSAASGSEMS
jgi:hypothetical protein